MLVKDIMQTKVYVIGPKATARDVAVIMDENKTEAVVVLDEEKLVGIVTERDIISKVTAIDTNPNSVQVGDIMTRKVITVESEQSLEEAAEILTENKIEKAPVLENGRLVGMLTVSDIVGSGVSLEQEVLKKLASVFPVAQQSFVGG